MKIGQQADGEDLDFPSEELPPREEDAGEGNRNDESVCTSRHESPSQSRLASLSPSLPTVAGVLPPSADSREGTSHFTSSSSAADAPEESSLSSAVDGESVSFSRHCVDGQHVEEEVAYPPSSPARRDSCSPFDDEGDGRSSSPPEENHVNRDKEGCGGVAEKKEEGEGKEEHETRARNESEKREMTLDHRDPDGHEGKACEAVSSSPEEERPQLAQPPLDDSNSLLSSSTLAFIQASSTSPCSSPPPPPPPPPPPSERLESLEVLSVPCSHVEPPATSASQSSSFPSSSSSFDNNISIISNISLLSPPPSIPQSILPSSLLFSGSPSSSFLPSSFSSRSDAKPSSSSADSHLDPERPSQSLLSSFSAGNLFWRVGKKLSHGGRAAVDVASRAATAAAVVTIGEPMVVSERGGRSPGGRREQGGEEEEQERSESPVIRTGVDPPFSPRKTQSAEEEEEGGAGRVNGRGEEEIEEVPAAAAGSSHADSRGRSQEGVGRGGQGGGGGEQGGSLGRRREEHEGEDHLRQEIEALREQIRIYHEALASMTSISPSPPVPPGSSSNTEEKQPSSSPSLSSSSSSASVPAQPGLVVDVPSSLASSSVNHICPASPQKSETTSSSSSSSPSSSGNEDEEAEEEEEKNSFLEFSEFFDRERLRKHFEEDIIEILSSLAAPAAASAALTATEAIVKEKLKEERQLQSFNFSALNIRSDVGSIAAATAVSLYEDESLFSRLVPVLSRLILEMVTAYNEEKRRRREERREGKEKTEGGKMKKVKSRSIKRRKRRKKRQEKEMTEREGQDRKESRQESDRSHRSTRTICEETQGKRRSEGGGRDEQQKSLPKYAELRRDREEEEEEGDDNRRSRSDADHLLDTHAVEESTRSSSDSCSSCQAAGSAVSVGTCRHGSGGGGGKESNDEEISRLMEKIRKQQAELDQQRDLNERQTRQIVQLTLQLTDLKTEEEERLAEERKKSEEKKEKEEEEKRVYEVLESQRVQLDELTAAVAESFELKCHLQELGKSYSQTRDQLQAAEEELREAREKIRNHLARIGELEGELLQEKRKAPSSEKTTSTSPREREQQEEDSASSSPSLPPQSSSCPPDERQEDLEEKEEGSASGKETSSGDKENRNSSDDIPAAGQTDGGRAEKSDEKPKPDEGVKKETRENDLLKESKKQGGGSGEGVLLLSPVCEKGKGGNRVEECSALSQTTAESEEGIEVKQESMYISKSAKKALQPSSSREQSLSSSLGEKQREEVSLSGKESGKGEGAEEEKDENKVPKPDKEEEALDHSTKRKQNEASGVRFEKEREGSEEKKIEELEKKIRSLQFELESLHARYLCEEKRQLKQLQNLRHLCTKEKQRREKSEAETQRWMARALERQMLEIEGNESLPLYDDDVNESRERTGGFDHDSVLSWQQSIRHIMVSSGVRTPEGTSSDAHLIPGTSRRTLEDSVARSCVPELPGDGSGAMNERSSLRREHERDTERSTRDRSLPSPPPSVLPDSSIGNRGISSSSHPTFSTSISPAMSRRHQDNTYKHPGRDSCSFLQPISEPQGGYEEEEYGGKKQTEGAVSLSSSSSDERAARNFGTSGASERRFLHEDDETRFRKEIEQLKISQELLQVDVAKKAEIISFLLKKYALREETFRGPPVSFSRSTGWRQLAVAAAEAMIGRGKERGSAGAGGTLDFQEMEKIMEETLLENIRLRTDLATLAEDMERSRKEEQGRDRREHEENPNRMAALPLFSNNTATKDCITNSEHQYLMECSPCADSFSDTGKRVSSSGKFLSGNSQGGNEHCVRQNNSKTSSYRGVDSAQIGGNCTEAKTREALDRTGRSDLSVAMHCISPVVERRSDGKPENDELEPGLGRKSTGEKQQTNHLVVRSKPSSPSLSDSRSEEAERSPTQGEIIEPLSEVVLFHADA